MKPLGLGEHGGLTIVREGRAFVAYLRYRDYSGSQSADQAQRTIAGRGFPQRCSKRSSRRWALTEMTSSRPRPP